MENELDKQPKLIPIYSHRYIPDIPNDIGTVTYDNDFRKYVG